MLIILNHGYKRDADKRRNWIESMETEIEKIKTMMKFSFVDGCSCSVFI